MKRPALTLLAVLISLYASAQYTDHFQNGDPIPDYSRVGYHWGDKEIPDVPVTITVKAPKDGSDATELIQKALDKAKAPGAVLLKAGTYNIDGILYMTRNGIVLRGEGADKTILVARGKEQKALLRVGVQKKKEAFSDRTDIIGNVPVAQMWARVADASAYKTGDRIKIRRNGTAEWIHGLKMDQIPMSREGNTKQWTPREYTLDWERTVVRVAADTIFFENPVVMEITDSYGGGSVAKLSCDRISEVGVEDIGFISEYDPTKTDPKKGYCNDEEHAWEAVHVTNAEHGWIRRITSKHFGLAIVHLCGGTKNFTVSDCYSSEPVSIITGGRRYAFNLSGAALCLIERCRCSGDRHQFVTGARVPGPNVFHRCEAVNSFSDCGPHHRWSTGVLYDCVNVDERFDVEDRVNWGSGHGWSGANFIFWNCEAGVFTCQSPWVSAKNYAIGCIGPRHNGSRKDNHDRPQGVWESYEQHVIPESLYEYQLEKRREAGIKAVPDGV